MKKVAILTMLMTIGLVCRVAVPAQKAELMTRSVCPASYPDKAEEFVANYINELVNKNLSDDPDIVAEAAMLKTPEGQKQVKKYLVSKIEIGDDTEKTYLLCSFLKEIALDLGKEDEPILKERLMEVTAPAVGGRTRRCLPFLCIFHLCSC